MALRPFDWRWIARRFKPPVQRLRRKRKPSRSDHAFPERLEERRGDSIVDGYLRFIEDSNRPICTMKGRVEGDEDDDNESSNQE